MASEPSLNLREQVRRSNGERCVTGKTQQVLLELHLKVHRPSSRDGQCFGQ